jgi:hypothetical protein
VRQQSSRCLLSELSAKKTSGRDNIGGKGKPHLPAVGIFIHDIHRQSNDQLVPILCFIINTETRCVPGSLWTKRSALYPKWHTLPPVCAARFLSSSTSLHTGIVAARMGIGFAGAGAGAGAGEKGLRLLEESSRETKGRLSYAERVVT